MDELAYKTYSHPHKSQEHHYERAQIQSTSQNTSAEISNTFSPHGQIPQHLNWEETKGRGQHYGQTQENKPRIKAYEERNEEFGRPKIFARGKGDPNFSTLVLGMVNIDSKGKPGIEKMSESREEELVLKKQEEKELGRERERMERLEEENRLERERRNKMMYEKREREEQMERQIEREQREVEAEMDRKERQRDKLRHQKLYSTQNTHPSAPNQQSSSFFTQDSSVLQYTSAGGVPPAGAKTSNPPLQNTQTKYLTAQQQYQLKFEQIRNIEHNLCALQMQKQKVIKVLFS
jgi:hypothetical protein